MAKTNPYTSRQTAALAFDEEQAEGDVRPLLRPMRPRRADLAGGDGSPSAAVAFVDQAQGPRGRAVRQRRAAVQHGFWSWRRWTAFLLHTRAGRILLSLLVVVAAVLGLVAFRHVRSYLERDPHFRIQSSAQIQIDGNTQLTRADLLSVFGADIGRNIFFVPLAARQAQLERVPWVAHATVMRLLPNALRVSVVERVPVAFVRLGNTVELIDGSGIVLHLPPAALAARHYSFPVVTGFAAEDSTEVRAERMQLYQRCVSELDAPAATNAAPLSAQLSEVDLSDLGDVRAVVPAAGSDILLHLGDGDFLKRYRSYQAHQAEWRQQYPHLAAVDLRYDRQVILKMADGSEDEASSVDHGNSLTPAPAVRHEPAPAHRSGPAPPPHKAGPAARHTAGHGAAHGWRPR